MSIKGPEGNTNTISIDPDPYMDAWGLGFGGGLHRGLVT